MTTTSSKERAPRRDSLETQLDRVETHAGARQGIACLVVSTGEAAGTVFPIMQPAVLIGRSAEAKVRIDEHAISNDHALLEMDGATYTLRDLGSTNGTHVNGQRITQKIVLASGDTVQMGSTTFLFVTRESSFPEATLELGGLGSGLVVESRRSRPRASAPAMLLVPTEEPPKSLSLTDLVGAVRRYWVYLRRYGWMVALCTCVGIGGGIAYAQLRPPPGSAWFEMKLTVGARSDDNNADFFTGAENTFRSLPLIRKALSDLGAPTVSDAAATYAQFQLNFKRMGYNSNVYRGEYEDVTAERAAAFLNQLLTVYIDSEVDKQLEVLRVDADFDRKQEQQAKERVAEVRGRLVAFSEQHPEAVPKDSKPPDQPAIRPGSGLSPERREQSIAAKERALRAAYTSIQTKKATPYLEQAAALDTKIADARAHGLKDKHPELRSLLDLQATLRGKADALLAAEPSANEKAIDPDVTRLSQELAGLRTRPASKGAESAASRRAVAPEEAALGGKHDSKTARASGTAPQSLAQLRIDYSELAGEYERAKTDHAALMKKREHTDRQFERERTSAKARYDVITPPTPAKKSPATVIGKRAGAGGAVGLVLALIVAACLELRRQLISRGHI
jgi:pSer/pThr/pTyr-binding forkhead associated (FHA) protein